VDFLASSIPTILLMIYQNDAGFAAASLETGSLYLIHCIDTSPAATLPTITPAIAGCLRRSISDFAPLVEPIAYLLNKPSQPTAEYE
jgi:hypothetical protein